MKGLKVTVKESSISGVVISEPYYSQNICAMVVVMDNSYKLHRVPLFQLSVKNGKEYLASVDKEVGCPK